MLKAANYRLHRCEDGSYAIMVTDAEPIRFKTYTNMEIIRRRRGRRQ
jgi:hypothetical protein